MATITGSVAGGAWNTGGAWVGGVQPTAGDDVLLTATSGNISIPTATTVLGRSLNCTGYTGTLTFASTTAVLSLGDATAGLSNVALTFVAGMTVTLTGIGVINFISTSTTVQTITTGGKTMPRQNIGNTGSKYQLADANTSSTILSHVDGTLDTNSQTCNWLSFGTGGVGLTMTLTLGSSAITLTNTTISTFDTGTSAANISGLTITANTAVVTLTGAGSGFRSSGKNWNGMSVVASGSGQFLITSSANTMTFANLTRTVTAAKIDSFQIQQAVTVTSTLTLNGNSATNRLFVNATPVGIAKTITAATLVCTNGVDFMDITGAGAATWTTAASGASSFGDCGGNSGITFTTPATQTHTASAGGNWSDITKWTSRVPLSQDNVIVDVNTTGTLVADMPRLGANIDYTGFAGTANFGITANSIFGNLTLSSGLTVSGTQILTFSGRGSQTITSAGKSFGGATNISAPGGTYTLQDAFVTTSSLAHNFGTFNANNFNVTCTTFTSFNASVARVVTMGSGTWTLTSTAVTTIWNVQASSLTINANTSTILISVASTNLRTFGGAGLVYNILSYIVAGSTGGLDITGANTFATLNFSDVTNARTLRFTTATTTTITGTFNVNGTATKLMTIDTITAATHTLAKSSGTVSCDYLSVKNSLAGGGATWYAGANSTDAGGNTGWIFTAPPSGTVSKSTMLLMGVG